ncbi:MAG: hypothetical protein U0800_27200, partial [Isosphaeraceae bacterium]
PRRVVRFFGPPLSFSLSRHHRRFEEIRTMAREIPEDHPLHRLFRGLTETTFLDELGIGDPHLVGYVSGLLARFVAASGVWAIRDAHGRQVRAVSAMVAEAESSADPERRRECHRHVGDFTLYFTGVFPEALGSIIGRDGADRLIDFQEQGKRSYRLAGTAKADDDQSGILLRLSDQFELCAFGLSKVRQGLERLDRRPDSGPNRLIA